MLSNIIKKQINKVLVYLDFPKTKIELEHPAEESHGDYSANIAMAVFSKLQASSAKSKTNSKSQFSKYKTPRELADKFAETLQKDKTLAKIVAKIEIAGPGFINFWLKKDNLINEAKKVIKEKSNYGTSSFNKEKIMVEFAHPNTHKEMHIGHMRTLITGESITRILEAIGITTFRANYQGDIGPHVAKAIWGITKILDGNGWTWDKVEEFNSAKRAHLLGDGYVKGNQSYKENKEKIDDLNQKLYKRDKKIMLIYKRTRKWSLDYYKEIYTRFGTKFDKLYFESGVADIGKSIVLEHAGDIFEKSDGAIIFDGEKYGLHKRVFVTKDGNPTYEGKDIGLAPKQFSDFPFDKNIHVVADEQTGYFKVVFKALEMIDSKFKDRQYHLPMGMVNLKGLKMSSRTGVVITVDGLIEEIKEIVAKIVNGQNFSRKEKEEIVEIVAFGAIKYSILKTNPEKYVLFDIKESVNLEGNSGPYLQYTYARARSVLRKSQKSIRRLADKSQNYNLKVKNVKNEEIIILRTLYKFPEIVLEAGKNYSPNLICNFLFDLAQKYNTFYNKHKIIGSKNENLRLLLTAATAQILKNGLNLLGIKILEKM